MYAKKFLKSRAVKSDDPVVKKLTEVINGSAWLSEGQQSFVLEVLGHILSGQALPDTFLQLATYINSCRHESSL